MDVTQHQINAGDWTLFASEYPAVGAMRGVVVIGHAVGCNRRTLDRPRGQGLASTLAQAGLHVYTFDVRAHGESIPRPADGGHWRYDDILNDVEAVVTWVHDRHPDARLGFLGHSLTGHAALLWVGQNPDAPVSALVLYSTNLWLPQFEPRRGRWLKKRATLAAWALLAWPMGYLPMRRLRMGTDDVPAEFVRDFRRFAKSGKCQRTSDGVDYLEGLATVKQPVRAYVGEKDRFLCTLEGCEAFLEPVPDHTVETVPGADHMSVVTRESSRPLWEETAEFFCRELGGSDADADA